VASISLAKAKSIADPIKQRATYEKIITDSTTVGETYTAIKAIVALGQLTGLDYTPQDKNRLIQSYHYLHKAGFIMLFNSCHTILWRIFEHEQDLTNLLQLFKYSSLVWRLRGRDKNERDAVKQLQTYTTTQKIDVAPSSQIMAYYLFRSTSS
jgi:hypothetical protein